MISFLVSPVFKASVNLSLCAVLLEHPVTNTINANNKYRCMRFLSNVKDQRPISMTFNTSVSTIAEGFDLVK